MAKIIVFIESESKRILGFGPEGLNPKFPVGTRYETKTPFDTLEFENWLKKFREQSKFDAEERAFRRMQREKPIRDRIKAAIRARNLSVNQINRDANNAIIAFMDQEYDRVMKQQANPETFGVAEAYDESKIGEEIALEAPIFKGRVQ
jgi:hypothetical protein